MTLKQFGIRKKLLKRLLFIGFTLILIVSITSESTAQTFDNNALEISYSSTEEDFRDGLGKDSIDRIIDSDSDYSNHASNVPDTNLIQKLSDYPTEYVFSDFNLTLNSSIFSPGESIQINISGTWKNNVTDFQSNSDYKTNSTFANSTLAFSWLVYSPTDVVTFNTSETTIPSPYNITLTNHTLDDNGYEFNQTMNWEGQKLNTTWDSAVNNSENITVNLNLTLIIDIPTYPAPLGDYKFILTRYIIDDNATIDNYVTNYLSPVIKFQVIDDLTFVENKVFLRRGISTTTNKTAYKEELRNQVLSPGDNVTLMGNIHYNVDPSEYVNFTATDLDLALTATYEENSLTMTKIYFYDVNGSDVIHGAFENPYNNSHHFAINLELPMENIYGTISLSLEVKFPRKSWANEFSTTIDLGEFDVKYRLFLNDTYYPDTDQTYSITQSAFGNFSLITTHFNTSLVENYPDNNISILIDLPADIFKVKINQSHEGKEYSLFEFTQIGYKCYWSTHHGFEEDQDLGTYVLKAYWLFAIEKGDVELGILKEFDSETIFSFTFTIIENYEIVQYHRGNNVTIANLEDGVDNQLSFKIRVPETTKIIDGNKNVRVNTNDASGTASDLKVEFDELTSEYIVKRTELTGTSGTLFVFVEMEDGSFMKIGTLKYSIKEKEEYTSELQKQPETIEKGIEWENIAGFAGAIVILFSFAVIMYFTLRR